MALSGTRESGRRWSTTAEILRFRRPPSHGGRLRFGGQVIWTAYPLLMSRASPPLVTEVARAPSGNDGTPGCPAPTDSALRKFMANAGSDVILSGAKDLAPEPPPGGELIRLELSRRPWLTPRTAPLRMARE